MTNAKAYIHQQSGWMLVLFLSLVNLCQASDIGGDRASGEWYKETHAIMGTEVSVELQSSDPKQGLGAISAVIEEMRRIDSWLSPYVETSELSKINRHAADRPVKISPSLFQLIQTSLKYSVLSNGDFDVSFAALGRQFDYRQKIKPSDASIRSTLSRINYRDIKLDEKKQTVYFKKPGMAIDLGGIAKGYAVDRGIEILVDRQIHSAIVGAGGDSRIIGTKNGKPWLVGIQDPRDKSKAAILIPLDNAAMSTSGDYQRYFVSDGVRHHHIINPRTGESVSAVRSVSIIGDTALETDALSTTVFVMGVEEGLSLVNRLSGVDAVIIDGGGLLHYSEGLLRATR